MGIMDVLGVGLSLTIIIGVGVMFLLAGIKVGEMDDDEEK